MARRRDRTVLSVLGVTAVALAIRVVGLGSRVAHWDEGRVAYWIHDYAVTGVLFYRPIIHGPLLHLVNAPLFELLGATDFVMRLVPALVGGFLPLAALLFRHRLRDATVVALAGILAVNPALVYYSRFMRGDILAAAFSFLALACLVRAIDFDDGRYLYPGTLALAVGFGAKENVLAYLVAYLGAAVLLLHHRLLFARVDDEPALTVAGRHVRRTVRGLRRHARALAGSVVVFCLGIVYVYAPRGRMPSKGLYYASCGGGYEGAFAVTGYPTLWAAVRNPLRLPELVAFTLGSTAELYACQWITPRTTDPNPYLEFLGQLAWITAASSTAVVALAAAGYLWTAYGDRRPNDLVSFGFYWGAASLVGYPLLADIGGAGWLAVHVVLPLSIPAAYALGGLYRWGREARVDGDVVSVALVVLLAVLVVGSMAWTTYDTSYANPTAEANPLVQYAQPSGDLKPTVRDLQALAARNDGTDLVLYGAHFHNPTGAEELERRPTCSDWFNALPLPWYFAAGDVAVDCAPNATALEATLAADPPPVVIANANAREPVDRRIPDRYETRVHRMRTLDTRFVYYLDVTRLEATRTNERLEAAPANGRLGAGRTGGDPTVARTNDKVLHPGASR